MVYDGYMRFGNTDIINDARTHQYAGGVLKCPGCDSLADAAGQVSTGYTTPVADQAPWTVGNNNGGCFSGLIVTKWTGFYDATRRLTVSEKIGTGGVPTSGRYGSKVLGVTARAVASSEAGMNAGIEWLTNTLTGTHPCETGDCAGSSLHLFDECPTICDGVPDTNSVPVTGVITGTWDTTSGEVTGGSPVEWEGTSATLTRGTCLDALCGPVTLVYEITATDPVTATAGAEPLTGDPVVGDPVVVPAGEPTQVILIVFPTPGAPDCWAPTLTLDATGPTSVSFTLTLISQASMTPEQQVSRVRRRFDGVVIVDGPKELDRVTVGGNVFSTLEWTMVATDPFMYRDPRPIWEGATGGVPVFLAAGVDLLADNAAFAEITCDAPVSSLTTCADNPACPPLLAPPAAPTVPGCDPDVATWNRQWVEIPAQVVGAGDAVLTADYTNPTGFAQTIRIRLYTADHFTTECAFTQELWVDYVPPGATVMISEGGQVLVTCDDGSIVNATRNVRGNYRGPYSPLVLGCTVDWVAAFDVAGADTTNEWDVSLVQRNG